MNLRILVYFFFTTKGSKVYSKVHKGYSKNKSVIKEYVNL